MSSIKLYMSVYKVHFGLIVTLCGVAYFVISVFVDRNRNRNFPKKITDKKHKPKSPDGGNLLKTVSEIYNYNDEQIVLLREIEVAEAYMEEDNYQEAALHFARAVSLCADPRYLLFSLKENLPESAYLLLVNELATNYKKRFARVQQESYNNKVFDEPCFKKGKDDQVYSFPN